MKRRTRLLISAGAGVILLASGTAAGAAISGPTDSSGVIYGCYTTKAVNGSHAVVLQDTGTTCPAGTTAIQWNQAGPPGAVGPLGPKGDSGPQGPPGPASLDALNGTACNAGSSDEGVAKISYDQGNVTITCVPTALETLAVSISGGNGADLVTSDPAGITCSTSDPNAICSEQVPIDYKVTLYAQPNGTDAFTGWGGACSGTSPTCTVKMSQAQNVTAQFAKQYNIGWTIQLPFQSLTLVSASLTFQPGNHSYNYTSGTSTGNLQYAEGTDVTITFTPGLFHQGTPVWNGACAGTTGDTCTLHMDSNKTFFVAES